MFLIVVIITWVPLQGQDKQYVVKMNGDTLYGKIMINPVRDNSRSMLFKGDDGIKKKIQALRYRFAYYSEKYQFRSVPYLKQRLFMIIVSEGPQASLYYYVHKRDNSTLTSRIVVNHKGEALELSVLNFKNQMREFMNDCPQVVARLDSREFRFKNYSKLVTAYNGCELNKTVVASDNPPTTVSSPKPTVSTTSSVTTATPAIAAVPPEPSISTKPEKSDIQLLRLGKIEGFKNFVNSLSDFESKKDILEVVVDLENRINQNSEIPDYLWSSLSSMVKGHDALTEKVQQLRQDIR